MNKNGAFGALSGAAVALVVFVIVVSLGALILDNFDDNMTTGSYADNATQEGLAGVEDLAQWTPTIVVIIVAVVILGLVGALGLGRRR